MRAYDHKAIEHKWQAYWSKNKIYTTPDSAPGKDNFYLLVEFPYPSGNLHVGHWYAFAVPDILARTLRMQGKNVLFPMGFDAFGLPAENAAIKNKLDPRKWTFGNIARMKKQIVSMGASFDWDREVVTCDPSYYRWTQSLFLQLFKKGLAYQKQTAVNWCPRDKTVLANEQVVDGKCERCGSEVVQREMLQWSIRITDYADRLIDDLVPLDWPEQIKESQRNWIGRSEGAELDFPLIFKNDRKFTYVLLHGFEGRTTMPRFLLWKKELEKMGHSVIIPALPNPDTPSEDEQVNAALAAAEYDENTVLFGHSLGAVVAMKVLEKLDKPIGRLVLAGGFVDRDFKDHPRNFDKRFVWKFDGEKIRKNTHTIQILHDPRDYAISAEQVHRLEETLKTKAVPVASDEPHFLGKAERSILMWLRPTIRVFTTRPDTLYGATYLVLAPEHPWVQSAVDEKHDLLSNKEDVREYLSRAARKTELERQTEQKDKTGVELKGVKAVNPGNGIEMPVYVADYVLGSYGTGAIMAVPAHDARDFEFAKKFDIHIQEVIEPLIVRTTGPDTYRTNLPAEKRDAVIAIVKHWSEDKYLCLQYKLRDLKYFVCGGIEKGEGAVAAGMREIREETGYTNVKFVRQLGSVIHSHFFQPEKGHNTNARFQPLLFRLEDGSREEVSERERTLHEGVWIDAGKVADFLNSADVRIAWDRMHGKSYYAGEGFLFNSGEFSGLTNEEAKLKVGTKFGRMVRQYRLRDWVVSRQRYWGVPIPIIHCPACGSVPVPEKELPVELPKVKDYLPDGSGKSPLANVKKWVNVKCPKCKGKAERETDTLDTFVDSSWYFLRYTDPKNTRVFASPAKLEKWMPVDLYSGGAEHTTMHVLYSRFWQKALYDLGLVKDKEPYTRRMNRSLILGPDGQKMSKSRGNVIDPDSVVDRLGADTVRMYLAFIGPYNEVANYPWNPDGVVGVRRFLERVWRLGENVQALDVPELERQLHRTIKKVGEDISALKLNTAISQLMIFLNAAEKKKVIGKSQWERFLRTLAPFAPHLCEELWSVSGHKKTIHREVWPAFDEAQLVEESVTYAIQIDGKMRGEVSVARDADKAVVEKAARETAAARLKGERITRVIVVPGRLINFVLET